MKNYSASRATVTAAALVFLLPFASCALYAGVAHAAPPAAKKAITKKTAKKHVVTSRHKKTTRRVPKPLPKPVLKVAPHLVVPAPKVVPAPVIPAPRPVPVPVPAPVLTPAHKRTPAQMNAPLAVGGGTLTLVKMDTTDGALPNLFGPIPPDTGTHYVVFTLRVKNETPAPLAWSLETFDPQLFVAGGESQPLRGIALLTAKNDKFEKQPIQPGEEKTLRFHFQVPQNAVPQTLTLGAENGPTYRFDVSGGANKF